MAGKDGIPGGGTLSKKGGSLRRPVTKMGAEAPEKGCNRGNESWALSGMAPDGGLPERPGWREMRKAERDRDGEDGILERWR